MRFMAVPPAPSISTRQSLESFNWNVSLRSVFDTICGLSGFVFVSFALALNIPKEQLGTLVSIASFACLFQMLGLLALRKVSDKKRFTIRLAQIEPVVMIGAVLLLPFLPQPWRFPMLGVAVFTAAASLHLARPVTDDWLASSIPGSIRGRYLGRRMQIGSLVMIATLTAAGFLAKGLEKTDPVPYSLFMTLGGLFGLLAAFALKRAHLPEGTGDNDIAWSEIPAFLKNKLFMGCILVTVIYNIPFWFAIPYYQVFNLRVLHMSEVAIAVMLGLYFVVKVVLSPLLGRLVERFGPRAMVFWVTVPYVYFFFSFTLCTPDRTWPLWIGWFCAAIGDAGYSLAITSALYESVPKVGPRKTYFVVNNLLTFAVAGLLAAFSAALTAGLKETVLEVGPWKFDQFKILFLFCSLTLIPLGFGSALFIPAHSPRRPPP
jgi:MFS family permease